MATATREDELRARIRRLDRSIAAADEKANAQRLERREARRALRSMGTSWAALAALSNCSTTAIHRDLQDDAARARHNDAKNVRRRVTT